MFSHLPEFDIREYFHSIFCLISEDLTESALTLSTTFIYFFTVHWQSIIDFCAPLKWSYQMSCLSHFKYYVS